MWIEATFFKERTDEFFALAKSLEIQELCKVETDTALREVGTLKFRLDKDQTELKEFQDSCLSAHRRLFCSQADMLEVPSLTSAKRWSGVPESLRAESKKIWQEGIVEETCSKDAVPGLVDGTNRDDSELDRMTGQGPGPQSLEEPSPSTESAPIASQ